ncbi:hypothetical protein AAG906_019421 [Vitis piasezkii]
MSQLGRSSNRSRGRSESRSRGRSHSRSRGRSHSRSRGRSHSRSRGRSYSRSRGPSHNRSRGRLYSRSRGPSHNRSRGPSHSRSQLRPSHGRSQDDHTAAHVDRLPLLGVNNPQVFNLNNRPAPIGQKMHGCLALIMNHRQAIVVPILRVLDVVKSRPASSE